MYREIQAAKPGRSPAPAVAVCLFDKTNRLPAGYQELDRRAGGALSAALGRKEFSAGKGALTTLYPGTDLERVYVLGLGSRDNFRADVLRIAGAQLVKAGAKAEVARLAVELTAGLEGKLDDEAAGRALGDGAAIGSFNFDTFKGAAGKGANSNSNSNGNGQANGKKIALRLEADGATGDGLRHALALGHSVNMARRLAATPPNVANPAYLVKHCRDMARKTGLKCTIIDAARAKQLNMGGLVAVGQAGSTGPAMICLEWDGRSAQAKKKKTSVKPRAGGNAGAGPLLLVGKAITFDTGGYSIKPAAGMESMKYDKCGGMAVIGAMNAAATLKLPIHVVGLIAAAENMVDSTAYRPSDIITFCNGVTAEITNTDAEGRLVLADALAYGTRTYKPAGVVDLATLTGGVVVALGGLCAGCFCADSHFRGKLFDAAETTGERLWELPLWPEHRDLMKSVHADIVNSGPREASPIQGAAFLSYFIEPDGKSKLPTLPWAHLDIAAVADVKQDTPLYGRGPTGYGVRLLAQLMEKWS